MTERFWDFSLRIYALPDVAPACLRCQDEAGADVNIVLLLLWTATGGVRLSPKEVAALDAGVSEWRSQVIEPLRALRRRLKSKSLDASGAFRERVKGLELEAERLEQEALATAAGPWLARGQIPDREAATLNLTLYEKLLQRSLPDDAKRVLVEAVFADD